jgi:hypothetical protein
VLLDVHPCSRLSASLRLRFGLADAPYVSARLPRVTGHGFVARIAAAYALTQHLAVGVELPFAVLSIEQPAGSYVDELTRGNIGLFVRGAQRWQRTWGSLTPFIALSLGLPLAERDHAGLFLASRALAIASALEAYRDQASFTAGVVPVTSALGLRLARGVWIAETSLRLPLLFRFSRAGLSADAATHPLGFVPVLHVSAALRPLSWLQAALSADAVVNAPAPVKLRTSRAVTQLSLTAELGFVLQEQLVLGLDFVAPLAGALGGWNYSGSVVLQVAW